MAKTTDVMTPAQRSRCMSKIRGRDTTPELLLRRSLWSKGIRYRLKARIFGKPDIVIQGRKLAIFVDGCFWHGCPEHGVQPKSNHEFWKSKIQGNIVRDKKVTAKLEKEGWTVLRFWEHEIENELNSVTSTIILICRKKDLTMREGDP